MKGVLEKLIGQEISLRTVDGTDLILTVKEVYNDAFLAMSREGSWSAIPFAAISVLTFK